MMFNIQELVINKLIKELYLEYERMYGNWDSDYGNIAGWAARLSLENIANSDMLYHNVEHTVMVSMAGLQILRGKHLSEGRVTPREWLHFMIAALCHDIGYVRGICQSDTADSFVTDVDGNLVPYNPGGTNAALTAYHVDRSKIFVKERFGDHDIIDADIITTLIEMTRFPVPDDDAYKDTAGYPGLLRASDLIGQLGDPDYLRKIPALFYEFEETGTNKKIGYKNPSDMRRNYGKFYWSGIRPYIQDGLRYLRITQEGKQWIANLDAHVFAVEHEEV